MCVFVRARLSLCLCLSLSLQVKVDDFKVWKNGSSNFKIICTCF